MASPFSGHVGGVGGWMGRISLCTGLATRSSRTWRRGCRRDGEQVVGEDVPVEKEADPFEGEALRLVDGQRVGESDGELGAFVGERTALDRAPVQRDEDFPRACSAVTR